ncbi:hypothetical protein VZT92_014579 [Zoarces viviparus]|uniref:Kinesin motor domain-containing protein n=1 Tax=Zoarces viviparus TaxID=48416 RepID=A0AAW1F126_ZOAVI
MRGVGVDDFKRGLLGGFTALPTQDIVQSENLQVYLRVRPFTAAERDKRDTGLCDHRGTRHGGSQDLSIKPAERQVPPTNSTEVHLYTDGGGRGDAAPEEPAVGEEEQVQAVLNQQMEMQTRLDGQRVEPEKTLGENRGRAQTQHGT